jgi:hypothetical protein
MQVEVKSNPLKELDNLKFKLSYIYAHIGSGYQVPRKNKDFVN